jgi:serine/threonine-protein kinase
LESPDAPIKFGRYELLRLLARGGMGEVYLARMQGASGWQKQLVIKRMLPHLAEDPAFARRFLEEARISTSLSHGNLVPVFDVGEHDGALFLAMDHVDGWDLRAIHRAELARGARLPDQLALFIVAEICRGLAYVHNRRDEQGRRLGLVHRDVSPSNILISRDGEAKLVDFGIAIAPDQAVRTATGELRGKLAYMSPEQARGERLDHRSDIYSLGVVLYELLTGERPVSTGSDMEVLARVQRGEHRPITDLRDDLPTGLAQLVERAIATSPDDRFEEVDELLLGLMRLLFSETGPVTHALLARHVGRLMAEPAPTGGMSLNDLLNAQLDEAAQSQSGARHLTPSRPTGSDRSARSAPPIFAPPRRSLHHPHPRCHTGLFARAEPPLVRSDCARPRDARPHPLPLAPPHPRAAPGHLRTRRGRCLLER